MRTLMIAVIMMFLSLPGSAQQTKLFIGPDVRDQYCTPESIEDGSCFIGNPLYLTGINNDGKLAGHWFLEGNAPERIQSVVVDSLTGEIRNFRVPFKYRSDRTFMTILRINNQNQVIGNLFIEDATQIQNKKSVTKKRSISPMNRMNSTTLTSLSIPVIGTLKCIHPIQIFKNNSSVIGTFIKGINDNGDIVGVYWTKEGKNSNFYLPRGGSPQDVPKLELPENVGFDIMDVNSNGDLAGQVYFVDTSGNLKTSSFIRKNGTVTKIDVPGNNLTYFGGMNNSGDITGNFVPAGGPFDDIKCYKVIDGQISTFVVGTNNQCQDINDRREIVGYSEGLPVIGGVGSFVVYPNQ